MKKQFFLLTAAALALASCSSDSYVGVQAPAEGTPGAIVFGGATGNASRGTSIGKAAADLLNSNFVVEGFKTVSSTDSKVFDDYVVTYTDGSANTTTSNSNGWKYVGVTSKGGVTQSIKYWDLSATSYNFIAYSVPTGVTTTAIDNGKFTDATNGAYTISGTVQNVAASYVSDMVKIAPTTTSSPVTLTFSIVGCKVRLGVYETIPGYKVTDIVFYDQAGNKISDHTPDLYTANDFFCTANPDVKVYYADTNNGTAASFSYPTATTGAKDITFAKTNFAALTADAPLGTTSKTATMADYVYEFPKTEGEALSLKIDYVLTSEDGSDETITMHGATATVPAEFTQWQRNYAYTYIFKISDKTNGSTKPDGDPGLFPITFDAVVLEADNGYQETITTVSTPSITTYQAGQVVTAENEYVAGDIYVVVDGATTLYGTAELYTAATTGEAITEASVANAYDHPGVDTDVTLTAVTTGTYLLDAIPGVGTFGTNKVLKIEATANTYYAFRYAADGKVVYKVIKVKPESLNP